MAASDTGTREIRTAAVTGASAGIGRAIAVSLGELGWNVAVGARRTDKLAQVAQAIDEAGGCGLSSELDVTKPASIDGFFASVEAKFGAPDVVVSNAGLSIPGLVHELDPQDVEREIATNLTGPILVARRAIPAMRQAKRGDLIFVTSLNAVLPRVLQVPYTATKAGLEAAVQTMQMELEGTGVRASIVRPGPTASDFGLAWSPEQVQAAVESWGKWGSLHHLNTLPPESVAHAVVQVATAPRGTRVDVVQLNPEAPVDDD